MDENMNRQQTTFEQLVTSIRDVHENLVAQASKAVNISLTIRNWLIGCHIAEYELHGRDRAVYGDKLLFNLATRLARLRISACSKRQLYQYLRFYRIYPEIVRSLTAQFQVLFPEPVANNSEKVRSLTALSCIDRTELLQKLSYTHIEQLVAIEDATKRTFYEFECIRGNWSVRELKRQIASLYYERSGLSKDKKKLSELAHSCAEQTEPRLAIRDPYIFEFLGIKSSEVMAESALEDAFLEYALAGIDNQLFVSKYQLALPSKEEMQHFLEREIAESGMPEENSRTGKLVREMRAKYGTTELHRIARK